MSFIQVEEPNPGFQTCGLVVDERMKWGHSDAKSTWKWEVHVRIFKAPTTNVMVITDLHKGQSVTNGIERILEVAFEKWPEVKFCQFVQHNPSFTWRDERIALVTFAASDEKNRTFKRESPEWKDISKEEVEAMTGWPFDFPLPPKTMAVEDLDQCFKVALPDNLPQELVAALMQAEHDKPHVEVGMDSGEHRRGYLSIVPHREVVGLSELVIVGAGTKYGNVQPKLKASAYLDWSQVSYIKKARGEAKLWQKVYSWEK